MEVLKKLQQKMSVKGYAAKTRQFYLQTVKEYILFHGKRDPYHMGMVEIELFMNYLSEKKGISFPVRQQAFQALMFFYTQVLQVALQKEYIDASRKESAQTPVNRVVCKPVQSVMVF